MSFHVPEQCRFHDHPWVPSSLRDGNNGYFIIGRQNGTTIGCQASDGMGWEHVSVSVVSKGRNKPSRVPSWEEMCFVKSLFWDPEDAVMQLHPPKSQYRNFHQYVLHLWRPTEAEIPLPDPIQVAPPSEGDPKQ